MQKNESADDDAQEMRTIHPSTYCTNILLDLAFIWGEVAPKAGFSKDVPFDEVILEYWEGSNPEPSGDQPMTLQRAMYLASKAALDGISAKDDGDEQKAWKYAMSASYWLGVIRGGWEITKDPKDPLRNFSLKGANARHAENRSMKQEVFNWLNDNVQNYKSMDAAAEAIAKVVAPIAFRTARDWVGEWKKLRSPGTA